MIFIKVVDTHHTFLFNVEQVALKYNKAKRELVINDYILFDISETKFNELLEIFIRQPDKNVIEFRTQEEE